MLDRGQQEGRKERIERSERIPDRKRKVELLIKETWKTEE